jgi:hypothetical protein
MLTNVFTKTTRDRWIGAAVAGGAISLWLLLGASVYRDIDLSIYTDMPEFMRNLMGIPEGADVGSLAYSVVLGFAGAVTLASLALSMGSASIAGEEKNGTFGLLLGNPKTRTSLLVSKAGSMVLLTGAAALILWGGGIVVPKMLDFETGGMFLEAIIFHLFVNAIIHGDDDRGLDRKSGQGLGDHRRDHGVLILRRWNTPPDRWGIRPCSVLPLVLLRLQRPGDERGPLGPHGAPARSLGTAPGSCDRRCEST